jgi:hypothetical protein
MPPRPPTVSEAVGLEGSIRLRWTANPESDLHRYRLYRTTEIGRDGSLDRMTLILETDAMRVAIAPPGAGNATRTGSGTAYITFTWTDPEVKAVRDHFYRLVAVDQSGNISEPSAAARARAFDTRPPAPSVGCDHTGTAWNGRGRQLRAVAVRSSTRRCGRSLSDPAARHRRGLLAASVRLATGGQHATRGSPRSRRAGLYLPDSGYGSGGKRGRVQ